MRIAFITRAKNASSASQDARWMPLPEKTPMIRRNVIKEWRIQQKYATVTIIFLSMDADSAPRLFRVSPAYLQI